MTDYRLEQDQKKLLLSLARESIRSGVENGSPAGLPASDQEQLGSPLNEPGACFVTLQIDGELRGCIGSLEPHRTLVDDVCANAFAAAFRDPRFPPLTAPEFGKIHIEISVLTPLEEMEFSSEENLLEQVVPFEDGLVLQEGSRKGTFLPLVWKQLPEKLAFLENLKAKAGLPPGYWSSTIRCFRYATEVFEE